MCKQTNKKTCEKVSERTQERWRFPCLSSGSYSTSLCCVLIIASERPCCTLDSECEALMVCSNGLGLRAILLDFLAASIFAMLAAYSGSCVPGTAKTCWTLNSELSLSMSVLNGPSHRSSSGVRCSETQMTMWMSDSSFLRGVKNGSFVLKNDLKIGMGCYFYSVTKRHGLRMVLFPWCRHANVELSTVK